MKPVEYINEMNRKLNWSDYRISVEFGISRSAVSAIRRNEAIAFSDENALKIAEALDIPEERVIADMHLARNPNQKLKCFWERFGSTAVVAILSFILLLQPVDSIASTATKIDSPRYTLCAMLRKWLGWCLCKKPNSFYRLSDR